MAKQIIVVLHADGRIETDLQGYQGMECERDALVRAIEELMEPGSRTEHKKPEYYQVRQQQVRQGGR